MKRAITLLLVLVMVLSVIPAASAESDPGTAKVIITMYFDKHFTLAETITVGSEPVTLTADPYYKTIDGKYYDFREYSNGKKTITIPAYDGTKDWLIEWSQISMFYTWHNHNYKYQFNRSGHWKVCRCGAQTAKLAHDDPAYLTDKVCHCGYIYSSNCELSCLWLSDMILSEPFKRDVTDYTAELVTYKDVTQTSISAQTYDALAKVTMPESLRVQDGINVFQVTVLAEDKEHTKTYTVTACRPVFVGKVKILSNGTTVTATPGATYANRIYTADMTDELLSKMAELAKRDGDTQIVVKPDYNQWCSDYIHIPLSAEVLKTIAGDTEADLVLDTHFGTATIPHAEIAGLADKGEVITVSIAKAFDLKILADGEELAEIPDTITLF